MNLPGSHAPPRSLEPVADIGPFGEAEARRSFECRSRPAWIQEHTNEKRVE